MENFFAHSFILNERNAIFLFHAYCLTYGQNAYLWGKKPALGWPAHAQIFLIITIRILFLYHISQLNVVSVIRVSDEYLAIFKNCITWLVHVQTYIIVDKHT